jgi:hypothetical protein
MPGKNKDTIHATKPGSFLNEPGLLSYGRFITIGKDYSTIISEGVKSYEMQNNSECR